MPSEVSAPFNMAINTLLRLGGILEKITLVYIDPRIPPNMKQDMKITLTRQFFSQASPLLKPEIVTKYNERFKKLRPNERMVAMTRGGMIKKKENKSIFDWDLEIEIDQFIIDIQAELQKEKFFMPPRKDPSKAVFDM